MNTNNQSALKARQPFESIYHRDSDNEDVDEYGLKDPVKARKSVAGATVKQDEAAATRSSLLILTNAMDAQRKGMSTLAPDLDKDSINGADSNMLNSSMNTITSKGPTKKLKIKLRSSINGRPLVYQHPESLTRGRQQDDSCRQYQKLHLLRQASLNMQKSIENGQTLPTSGKVKLRKRNYSK